MLDRAEAYLGVLVDDLVTRGVSEPYRMFTSRAEYRLTLRADNADQRLTSKGEALGLIGPERATAWRTKEQRLKEARALVGSLSMTPNEALAAGLHVNQDGVRRSAFDLLALPGLSVARLATLWPSLHAIEPRIVEQLETDASYAVYLDRQQADIDAFRREEDLDLPADLAYGAIAGLSNEVRQKLELVRPRTIGQASRIDGMTPAALTLLVAHSRRERRPTAA